jgi:hypothetical protein
MEERVAYCEKCHFFINKGDVFQCGKNKRILNFFIQHANSVCPENRWSQPSLPQQAASLGKSLLNWTASGFSPTPPDILAVREATCRACPEWDDTSMAKTGRCRICGCSTWAKLRMATERCPLGKWEPVTATP